MAKWDRIAPGSAGDHVVVGLMAAEESGSNSLEELKDTVLRALEAARSLQKVEGQRGAPSVMGSQSRMGQLASCL